MVLCLGSTCSALHNQGPFKAVCCWQGGRQRWKSSRGTRPTQDGTWPAIEIAQITCTHILHIAYNKSESGISCCPLWGKGHDYSAQNRTEQTEFELHALSEILCSIRRKKMHRLIFSTTKRSVLRDMARAGLKSNKQSLSNQ